MEHLHAYWRMEYVTDTDRPDRKDVFLQLPHNPDDRQSLIILRGEHTYLVLNRYPYNAGHLLAVPYRKTAQPGDLSPPERHEFFDFVIKAQDILQQALQPDGFNIGINLNEAAGAGIPDHLHCHVVPRWHGDTNFMPVIGKTRVLPTALDAMWDRLKSFA